MATDSDIEELRERVDKLSTKVDGLSSLIERARGAVWLLVLLASLLVGLATLIFKR